MMRIRIPAIKATSGWNAGWIGMSTPHVCQKSIFRELMQPQAVVPHDLALGVRANAGEHERVLNQDHGKRSISVELVVGHDDVAVGDIVDHNL
jgi:hypothetical protein